MEEVFTNVIHIASAVIEIWGVSLIIISVLKEIFKSIFKYKLDTKEISLDSSLNHGLAAALEVLLAGEILETLIAHSLQQLLQIGLLVIIRVFIAFVLQRELKHKIEDPEYDHTKS